jgi:hypothetical protein
MSMLNWPTLMNPSTSTDILLLMAPAAGSIINFLAQLALVRISSGIKLVIVVLVAFCIGASIVAALAAIAFSLTMTSLPDVLALTMTVFVIYSAASFILFALINLGETSLRIRMLALLMSAPNGLTELQLIQTYDNETLVRIRLDRLRANNGAGFVDGIYYPILSLPFVAAFIIRTAKRLIYGNMV